MNFGSSVIKREAKDFSTVTTKLERDGWSNTGGMVDRVQYYEKSGINITVLNGPAATLIFPSGPLRGTLHGRDTKLASRTSVMGMGKNSGSSSSHPTKDKKDTKYPSDNTLL